MAFQSATGTTLQFVPYRGGAPALNDLVAGQIDLTCDLAANSLAQYRTGNIKAFAVMTKSRWSAAPEVPTAEEAGFPGLYFSTWHGFWAPKDTPADVIAKINAAANAAMADPEVRKRIADLGMDLPPADSDPGSVRSVPQGRVREMVADREGSRRQGGVSLCTRRIHLIPNSRAAVSPSIAMRSASLKPGVLRM